MNGLPGSRRPAHRMDARVEQPRHPRDDNREREGEGKGVGDEPSRRDPPQTTETPIAAYATMTTYMRHAAECAVKR